MKIAKYFWNLNEKALKETSRILKIPDHPKFAERMVTLLSRCESAKELFTLIPKKKFVQNWPKIRSYWQKVSKISDFRDWWETIYEQIIGEYGQKVGKPKGKPADFSVKTGLLIKNARIQSGLSQKELAIRAGMKQPDISRIEEGKKNITIATLVRICKILKIKKMEL